MSIPYLRDELDAIVRLPDNEEDDANMGGVVHIPYPQNPGGKDRASAEWVTLYELGTNSLVKAVRRVEQWRNRKR